MIALLSAAPSDPGPRPVPPTLSPFAPTRQPTVAVVGAGIIGACMALVLRRAGVSTTLFDPQPPGSGTSSGLPG